MNKLTCIICPKGCEMYIDIVDEKVTVTGNQCPRGENFAVSEYENPVRTICSTVRTVFRDIPVLPVRVSADIPKSRIFDVMTEINRTLVSKPVRRGEPVIRDVLGLGVDVIASSDILKDAGSCPAV